MSENKDEIKGRVKEAAGAILDDEELRKEGRLDQAAGKIKKKAGEIVDRLRDAVDPDDAEDERKGRK